LADLYKVMIKLCPFCGHSIGRTLIVGITTCDHCSQVFDSSEINHTLSAAWIVRRWYIFDIETLKEKFDFSDPVLELVDKYVIKRGMCHDDFIKVAREKIDLDQTA